MRRQTLAILALTGLAACSTTPPGPGWHHPEKPVSAFDFDFYHCRMIALQTIPQLPTPPVANALYSQCQMIGNVQQCWQQQAPIYTEPNPPATPDPAWLNKVEASTAACIARQGWTRIGPDQATAP